MDTGNSISSVYRNQKSCGIMGRGESYQVVLYWTKSGSTRVNSGELTKPLDDWRMSSRRIFLRWEDQMLQSSLKHNCKDVTYDGQPLQASAAPGLTDWDKALQCLKSSVTVPHSLNSARDGNYRAEITCASFLWTESLFAPWIFYSCAKQSLKHHWFALGGKQHTLLHILYFATLLN